LRLYMVLIFTAVVMAFTTGYIALFLQGSYRATSSEVLEINNIKKEFQRAVEPSYIINFNSLYFSQDQFQLLDPVLNISGAAAFRNSEKFSSSDNCDQPLTSQQNRKNFEKTWVWEEFRCNRLNRLPRRFFIEGPFLHPSGKSFAYLAFRLRKNNLHQKAWVMAHLPFFHVNELAELRRFFGELRGVFNILEDVSEEALLDIMRGKGTILSRNYLFARLTYPKIFNILEYRIYSRTELDKFLKDSPYILHAYQSGRTCFYRDGSLCWDYNVKHIFQLANTSTIALFFGLIVIILVVVRLLLVKIRAQRLEDEKRRLALRVLTHEFRTPITSLTLLLEKMGNKYSSFDEEMEEVYLRLSSEVHRLRRLTETSRNYLKAEQKEKLLDLNYEETASLNHFVEEVLEPFIEAHPGELTFTPLSKDLAIEVDSYWLGICMKNIVENAFTHGKCPVEVSLIQGKNSVTFKVLDHGKSDFDSLSMMTQEFMKGNKSTGTGLGMNIVKKVSKEMGIALQLELNPTVFTLCIPMNPRPPRKGSIKRSEA
jgi:signal transduction histidine kinase